VDAAIERGRRQNKKYGKKEHQREGSAEEGRNDINTQTNRR